MRYFLILFLFIELSITFNTVHAATPDWEENEQVAKILTEAGTKGTFVLFDVTLNKFTGYNFERANTRYIPASTFKIPNSLIGLETGAVKNVDEIIVYDGKPVEMLSTWKTASSLRDAIKVSNLPIYQTLARRIGLARMREQIAKINYGNNETGDIVDSFWIRGPLKISAIEQIQFLAKLARQELHFAKEHQLVVREIIKNEQGYGWTIYAKTGYATICDSDIGWWVGWVVR